MLQAVEKLGQVVTFVRNASSYLSYMQGGMADKEIISRVLQGDRQFFAELVNRHQHFVFTIALRYARNRQDAEEIAQDVFVKAYRSLADYKQTAKFSTWLYAITANTCSSFLRKKKLETRSLTDQQIFDQANNYHAGSNDIVANTSGANLLNRAMRLLNAEDSTIITLFYKGDQSIEEIGKILGIKPNNAKVKLHRARQRLKEKMELHFGNEVREMCG